MNVQLLIKISLIIVFCFNALTPLIENMPVLRLSTTFIRYATLLYIACYGISNKYLIKFNATAKLFIAFFIIYTIIIFDDLTFHRIMPLKDMLGVPDSISTFIKDTIYILLILCFAPMYLKLKDYKFLYRWYIILTLVPIVFYTYSVGTSGFEDYLDRDLIFNPLSLSNMAASSLLVVIGYKKIFGLTKNEKIIFYIFIVMSLYVFTTSAKRGPLLWFFVSLIIYYYAVTKNRNKFLFTTIISFLILYACGNIILESLKDISPYFISRIQDAIYEGDTSGRFSADDSDSGYMLAIQQILNAPWFGSYFRLTTIFPLWRGLYPHNIILEALITFGFIGLIPFLYFIIKAIRNGVFAIRHYSGVRLQFITFFFLIFINSFLSMMTTGTFLLNTAFWISLMFLILRKNA